MTTDTPEVSPSRSSRTRDRSSQESTPAVDRRPTCLTHYVYSDYSEDRTIRSRFKNRGQFVVSTKALNNLRTFSVLPAIARSGSTDNTDFFSPT